jgi:hypothetical protein
MVPRGRGNDTARPVRFAQPRHEAQTAAHLEGARRVVILVLHPHVAAEPLVDQRVLQQR